MSGQILLCNRQLYRRFGLHTEADIIGKTDFDLHPHKLALKYQRDDLERNLRMQVQAAQDNIAQSVKEVASNKEGVRQAEKAYEIMQKSFEIGSATFVELNDADLALTNSRLAYNQAIYDYLTAKAELNMILGKNIVEVDNNK